MSGTPRALIADDEPALAEYLRARLAALWPELALLPVAKNGLEALSAIRDEEPEIAFLDIRMPGLTGLELAARIDTPTHVVFVTAYDQYAVEAFDRDAVDYILKPVTDDRLARAIERLKAKLAAKERPEGLDEALRKLAKVLPGTGAGFLRWVRALKGEEVQQIAVQDVMYFQAQDKYTCVITAEGESLIRTVARRTRPAIEPGRLLADPPLDHHQHGPRRLDAPRPRRAHFREAEGHEGGAARVARLFPPFQTNVRPEGAVTRESGVIARKGVNPGGDKSRDKARKNREPGNTG